MDIIVIEMSKRGGTTYIKLCVPVYGYILILAWLFLNFVLDLPFVCSTLIIVSCQRKMQQ